MMRRITNPKSNLFHQFLFLMLIYVEYPLMIFLVCTGLAKMDFYHMVMLLFFVVYTANPRILKKWTILLLIFSDFFVLEKYIYTLCVDNDEHPKNWVVIVGFYADRYDAKSNLEYFRYPPRLD